MADREWREITKKYLKTLSKDIKFKVKFSLSYAYLNWIDIKYNKMPSLFDRYKEEKGIIEIRDMFLSENKIDREAIKACEIEIADKSEPEFNEDLVDEKLVIVPISTIGCGIKIYKI